MPNYKDTENKLHWLDDESHEYLLPAGSVKITEEEAAQIKAAQTPIIEPDPKMVGVDFDGVMCSATSSDAAGLLQVKAGIDLMGDKFSTKFKFANGNSLVLSAKNFLPFMAVWIGFRQSFFKAD